MNTDLLTVTRDNKLVQSSYELSWDERRAVELAIAKVKFGEPVPKLVEITGAEFAQAFNIDPKNAYKQLRAGVDRLYERSMELIGVHTPESLTKFRLISRADYVDGEGRVMLRFTEEAQQLLLARKEKGGYTTYKILHVKRLTSKHAMRLFELLMQYKSKGVRIDKLQDLKAYFGVQDKYRTWGEFERRVISPAVKNLNESSNWNVKHFKKKKGRSVHEIKFLFSLKSQQLLDL